MRVEKLSLVGFNALKDVIMQCSLKNQAERGPICWHFNEEKGVIECDFLFEMSKSIEFLREGAQIVVYVVGKAFLNS